MISNSLRLDEENNASSEALEQETGLLIDRSEPTQRVPRFAIALGTMAALLTVGAVMMVTNQPKESHVENAATGDATMLETASCAAVGGNCLKSKCCQRGGKTGYTCYAKDKFWASCSESCEKGPHAGEFDGKPWSCEELGSRSSPAEPFCPQQYQSCTSQKCCAAGGKEGLQCFEKNASHAVCLDQCVQGIHPGDTSGPWSCKPVGGRSTRAPEFCPKLGEKCVDEMCCGAGGRKGLQCYEKKPGDYAICAESCKSGVHPEDPDGLPWTCAPLGPKSVAGAEFCPGPTDNCLSAGCCAAGGKHGLQCYKKDETWGGCMEGCKADMVGGPWSCEKIGSRSPPDPCSAPGENCNKTKCCSGSRGGTGMTCYEKDLTWSSCKEGCDSHGTDKGWSCKAMGERTKYSAGCSWAGLRCDDTKLCCNKGFVCAVKDELFSGCVQTEKMTTWVTQKIPIPSNWEGTVLGGGRNEYQVPAAAEGEAVAGTSLFCFMAMLPDSPEVALMQKAKDNHASIFDCDASAVFHSWQSGGAGWDTGETTLLNTDVFLNVWQQVMKDGQYRYYDWTVKVDPDAVLVPARLRAHISGLRPPAYRPIYLKNNGMDPGMGNNGFLGAVEVFSKQALNIYFDNWEGCKTSFGLQAGEDGFFKGCMDALGVGFMLDENMFFPDKSPGACGEAEHAAFHPIKGAHDWQCCWDLVMGKQHRIEYGHCLD